MLCILAKIDEAGRQELLKVQSVARDFGICPKELHGHVTLACYVGSDEGSFIDSCRENLRDEHPFMIYYDHIDVFEVSSVIAAAPRREEKIECVHKDISDNWSEELNCWTKENVWLPHTTLLQDKDADLMTIAEAMKKKFRPFSARVTELEFSRVLENNKYEIVGTIPLN